MMKQLDMIHYQNNEHCGITMIGTEVHTEYGFSPRRLLYVVKMYSLPADDAKTLFSMRRHATELKVPSIRIIIISSSFNKGTEYPVTEECLTDIQATRVIQYLSVYGCITPDLDRIKEVMDESDNELEIQLASNGLLSPVEPSPRTQQQYEQSLREQGRSILAKCRRITSFLCSQHPRLAPSQKLILYAVHNNAMQLVSSFVVYGVFRHCRDAIHRFNLARKRLQNLTMEEARIPALFRCNFSSAITALNNAYFSFENHPETVLPLGILSCWNCLLSDIRYAVNTEIVKKNALKEEEMKSEHCDGCSD
ncbi:hypothetical protein WA577_006119 [Blastocystis sp. JDR]